MTLLYNKLIIIILDIKANFFIHFLLYKNACFIEKLIIFADEI